MPEMYTSQQILWILLLVVSKGLLNNFEPIERPTIHILYASFMGSIYLYQSVSLCLKPRSRSRESLERVDCQNNSTTLCLPDPFFPKGTFKKINKNKKTRLATQD